MAIAIWLWFTFLVRLDRSSKFPEPFDGVLLVGKEQKRVVENKMYKMLLFIKQTIKKANRGKIQHLPSLI